MTLISLSLSGFIQLVVKSMFERETIGRFEQAADPPCLIRIIELRIYRKYVLEIGMILELWGSGSPVSR